MTALVKKPSTELSLGRSQAADKFGQGGEMEDRG
jgi:hypothetical protein